MARFNRGYGRVFIPLWLALVGLFTVAAVADSFWDFGWGYEWKDAGIGLLMFGCGIIFWFFWHGALKLSEWFNDTMFGPDASKKDD